MVEKQISMRWSYRSLSATLALAVFVFVLMFLFSANPVYAYEDPVRKGGGGGGGTPPSNTICGYVYDYDSGAAAPGIKVYINLPVPILIGTTGTDGYFSFSGNIYPNDNYRLTVNGMDSDLGSRPDDYHWGQRATSVVTDNNGYAYKTIYLQRAALVNVTAAALFSNTQYAILKYEMGSTSIFDHTVTFNVAGTGISLGYATSKTASRTFEVGPLNKRIVYRPHYANTYQDDMWAILKTGITEGHETQGWGLAPTQEYIDPSNITGGYEDIPIPPGDRVSDTYTETGSYTWSSSVGIDFSIKYTVYGIPIELTITVTSTSGIINTVYWEIDRTGDTNPNTLMFRIYTAGALYDPGRKIGGMELHVWEKNW